MGWYCWGYKTATERYNYKYVQAAGRLFHAVGADIENNLLSTQRRRERGSLKCNRRVTQNGDVYHAAPSHHFNVYKMQLPVWCLILASVIMWHQHFSSCTGYLWSTESSTSCVHWCTRSTLDVHHSTWSTLCSQSLNPAVDLVWGPPTLPTTSNAALVRSLVKVASVMLVQLPGTLYLSALSSLLTPIDSKYL